jgi:hypothetical protein
LSTNKDEVSGDIKYQTRFPSKNIALIHKGADASSILLATITTHEHDSSAQITFPTIDDGGVLAQDPITIENIADEGYSYHWPVKVRALGVRELQWEYDYPVFGDNCMLLKDPVTGEGFDNANDYYLALGRELPEAALEELVITSTAAMIAYGSGRARRAGSIRFLIGGTARIWQGTHVVMKNK